MLRLGTSTDVERLYSSFWDDKESFFTWGNEDLDQALPLLSKEQLVVITGAQASGKTFWSFDMALENARAGQKNGYGVGYLALEVSMENMIRRRIEVDLKISKEDRRKGYIFDVDNIEEKKIESEKSLKGFIHSGLMMFPETESDDNRLLSSIAQICEEGKVDILFIDNLAEILSKDDNEYEKHDTIMRTLSDLRTRTHTTIVLLHHLAKPKTGEPLSINSVKGNNIIVTKADTAVGIDRQDVENPNWSCLRAHEDGTPVAPATLKKFYSYAPKKITGLRAIYTFKDRWYGEEGLRGYMRINKENGALEFLTTERLKHLYPLDEKEEETLKIVCEKLDLLPAGLKKKETVIPNEETLPWNA